MKKAFRSYRFIILIFILVGWPQENISQNGFQEGYVVTKTNDTLYGVVRDRKLGAFAKLYKKIKFKGKKGKTKYAAKDLFAYKNGDVTFEIMKITRTGQFFNQQLQLSDSGDYEFFKVIHKGNLSYYMLEFEDADSGHIDGNAYFKKENEDVLIRVNQGVFGLKRKKLARYFSDYPELSQRILNKQLNSPLEIVRFYNTWKINN
ncbi:hypothetical protein [Aurantibacter sp.]|uniref:hypothetical protein n=1 Tax=Aurantibacter sp. TaxID=2807103 RepID=UPI0032654D95